MPSVVAQYSHTYIGQAIENTFKFYMPMLTKLRDSNYWDIEVSQIGLRRPGTSTPHDIIFCVADIQGTKSQIVTDKGQIDSRQILGMINNYDSGASPSNLTATMPVNFRLNSMQPGNPFTVTLCRLMAQELLNQIVADETQPSTLVPIGTIVNTQFSGKIDSGTLSVPGTQLEVLGLYSPTANLAVGQTIKMTGISDVTITALGTGTGGVGTYTVSASRDSVGVKNAISISSDTSSNSQLIMNWTIKEMSPYEMPRGEIVKY